MHQQPPILEWQIAESDAAWEQMQIPFTPERTPDADPPVRLHRYLWRVAAMFLLLASTTGGLRRANQTVLPQPIADVTTVEAGSEALLREAKRSLETPYFIYRFR